VAVAPDVGHVQEGGALQAHVHEGRLHARQHAHDAAQVDVADDAAAGGALDMHFLDDALLHEGDPGFLGVKLIRYSSDMVGMANGDG
jgi:predicted transcriptional regulator